MSQFDHVTFSCVSPQPCGEQFGSAASRPAASSLPAALHPLRSGQGEGGRRLLGVCPPPQQAARLGSASLPGRSAVSRTLKLRVLLLMFCSETMNQLFYFLPQKVLACFPS